MHKKFIIFLSKLEKMKKVFAKSEEIMYSEITKTIK